MLTRLVHLLYRLLPKRSTVVLCGQPDYCDDVLSLESALHRTKVRKVVILTYSAEAAAARGRYPALADATVVVPKRSLRGVLHLLTAKYVFFTHSFPLKRFPDSVVSVNLWHGMPVKRVGWMTESGPLLPRARYAVATSSFWEVVIQESLRPLDETLVTGLPRNDRLLLGDRGLLTSLGGAAGSGDRMIAWLPTYRTVGKGRTRRAHCSHVLGLSAEALRGLNELLEKHRVLLVVKRHPLAAAEDTPELSHIRYINDEWLEERGFTLHELLGESCALVTDVSSAYVDYLVLDRPIVHHFPDVQEYGASRGYSITPIEEYLAGPLATDPAELTEALAAVLAGKDTHADARRQVRALFHEQQEGSATERLLSGLGLEPRA